MSAYAEGAVHQLADGLEKMGLTSDDLTRLRSYPDLKNLIRGRAEIVPVRFEIELVEPSVVAKFLCDAGVSIWKGPADGDGLDGAADCVSEPDQVDLEHIVLETHLIGDETSILGEEKMKRARASKNRQLAGRTCLFLLKDWQEKNTIGKPENAMLEKLYKAGKIGSAIYFFGLTLRSSGGSRCALYLVRFGGGSWYWYYDWLDDLWGADIPSVALASV